MTRRRISYADALEMRRLRYTEHLSCATIATRFNCSRNCVSLHTKVTAIKPTNLHDRWLTLLPAMLAEIRKAATPPPKSQYPPAARAIAEAQHSLPFGDTCSDLPPPSYASPTSDG